MCCKNISEQIIKIIKNALLLNRIKAIKAADILYSGGINSKTEKFSFCFGCCESRSDNGREMFTNERVKVCFWSGEGGGERERLGRVQVFCINIHAALTK